MAELVDVAVAPSQSLDYVKGLRSFFKEAGDCAVPELSPKKPQNGAGAMDWDTASKLMLSAMKMKKKLEYGRD